MIRFDHISFFTFVDATVKIAVLIGIQCLWWRSSLKRKGIILYPTWILIGLYGLIPALNLGLGNKTESALLLFCFGLSYLMTFPAIAAQSPSLEILRWIQTHKATDASYQKFLSEMGQERLLSDRLNDLEKDRFVKVTRGEHSLTTSGRWLAAFFVFYRKLLGLRLGEG